MNKVIIATVFISICWALMACTWLNQFYHWLVGDGWNPEKWRSPKPHGPGPYYIEESQLFNADNQAHQIIYNEQPKECDHNHAAWRLDLTKNITEYKKTHKGPSDYSFYMNSFKRAFEQNDVQAMNYTNDKMKEIELQAGVINDVDIIERLVQIKKVKSKGLLRG